MSRATGAVCRARYTVYTMNVSLILALLCACALFVVNVDARKEYRNPNMRADAEDLGEVWQKEWELVCEWEGLREDREYSPQQYGQRARNSKGEKYPTPASSKQIAEDMCPIIGEVVRDDLNRIVKERILSRRQRQHLNIPAPEEKEWEDDWKNQISDEIMDKLDSGELDHVHIPQSVVEFSLAEPFHHAGLFQLSMILPLRRVNAMTKAQISELIRTETRFYSWVTDMLSRRADKMLDYLGDGNKERAEEWLTAHGTHLHKANERAENKDGSVRRHRRRHWSEINFHDEL